GRGTGRTCGNRVTARGSGQKSGLTPTWEPARGIVRNTLVASAPRRVDNLPARGEGPFTDHAAIPRIAVAVATPIGTESRSNAGAHGAELNARTAGTDTRVKLCGGRDRCSDQGNSCRGGEKQSFHDTLLLLFSCNGLTCHRGCRSAPVALIKLLE